MNKTEVFINKSSDSGYSICHPWYYYLGGKVLSPKELLNTVKTSGYKGYRKADILHADAKEEPKRSEALRLIKKEVLANYKRDVSGYRKYALQIHRRKNDPNYIPFNSSCDNMDTNMSLKTSHLINCFAHLIWLDELLSVQGDLFGTD